MDLQVPGSALETLWQEESQVNWNLFVLITFICLVGINIAPQCLVTIFSKNL